MDLQTIYYTMGIIFMSLMFIFMIALVVMVFYIKNKVTALQKNLEDKIETVTSVGHIGEKAFEKIKEFVENKKKKK